MLVPTYRRLPSTLHSARAGVASLYCVALALVAVLFPHPLVLAAVGFAVISAGAYAGVGRELVTRSLRLALPFALLVVVINGLVSQRGATVVFRFGTLPRTPLRRDRRVARRGARSRRCRSAASSSRSGCSRRPSTRTSCSS